MQLPAFITRVLGFAEKTETHLAALVVHQTETATLRTEVASLRAENASLTSNLALAKSNAEAALAIETAKVNEQAAEIVTLKASVETEKRKATDLIASQGLPADRLPTASPSDSPGSAEKPRNATEECLAANRKRKLLAK